MARFNSSLISNTITGTTSVGSPFNGSFTALTGTAPYTVTLANPTLFPGINQQFYNGTGGTVTLSTPAGNFVGAGGSAASTFPVYAGNVVSVTADGTNYIVISEDGSALTATSATISGVLTVQSSGGVAIAPSTTGTIDNVNVGATTRGSGSFNTLTANNAVTFTANTASSTTGTGTVVITGGLGVSGTINATSVSASLTGTIQTAAQTNITSVGNLTSLTVDTTTLVVDATNDRVGIGITNPAGKLSVIGGGVAGVTTYLGGTVDDGLMLGYVPSIGLAEIIGVNHAFSTYNDIGLRAGNNTQLYLSTNGKVGIGTATPDVGLTVGGAGTVGGNAYYGKLSVYGGGDENSFSQTRNEVIRMGRADITGSYYHSIWSATGSGQDSAHWLRFYLSKADGSSQTMTMQLDANGNVGIGTVSPGAHLEISAGAPTFILNANSQAVNSKKIRLATSNNNAGDFVVSALNDDNSLKNYMFYASNAGNIGLGSTAPGTYGKLDIYQATDPGITPAALSIRLQGTGGGSGVQYGINIDASQSYNNSTPLYGIKSVASQNTGQTTYGVHSTVNPGNSNTARFGVYGKSGFNSDAVHGLTNSTLPVGVYGEATNATGTTQLSTSAAGYFLNSSTLGALSLGVYINTTAGPTSIVPLRIDHASTELLRVDSAGRMGIGTNSPSSGYAGTISNVKLALRGGIVGQNGGSSTLLIGGDNDHYAAITGTHVSGGMTYLVFSTSLTTSNPTERMRILSNGKINRGGVSDFYTAGETVGNQSFFIDIPVENDNPGLANTYHIQCSFSHANWSTYGCLLHTWVNYRGSGNFEEQTDIKRINGSVGGSWSVSKPNTNSIRITKNAGSYPGNGPYWIRVTMSA